MVKISDKYEKEELQMSAKHFTMRGEPIDMAAIANRHGTQQAVGNAGINARGDVLGPNGTILKTQEQVEEEWRRIKAQQEAMHTPPMNIKAPLDPQMPNMQAAPLARQMDEFEPPPVEPVPATAAQESAPMPTRRRKIVEE